MPERKNWGYLVMWEFQVRPGSEAVFEKIYGPGGDWVQLFKKGEGFVATELVRDLKRGSYVTLDFWRTKAEYERFREQAADLYKTLDEECEKLTQREALLGTFERIREPEANGGLER